MLRAHGIRLLAAYVETAFLRWMALRSFVFTLAANQAVAPLVGLAVWSAALPGRAHVSTYYVALLVVQLVTVSYEEHTFSQRIYSGELADDLLRPHPVVFGPLSENLAIRIWHLLIGLPLLLVLVVAMQVRVPWAELLPALPALALAAALRFLFTYMLSLSAFWTEKAHGVVGFGASLIFLLGGAAAPVELLPPAIRPWGEALPFRAMHALPAEIASGWLTGPALLAGYAWQLAWLFLLAGCSVGLWRLGVRRYTAVGG